MRRIVGDSGELAVERRASRGEAAKDDGCECG
jgi:hypothetical protein